MMFCKYCGKKIKEHYKYCKYCGKYNNIQITKNNNQDNNQKNKENYIIMYLIMFIVLLIGIILIILLFSFKSHPSSNYDSQAIKNKNTANNIIHDNQIKNSNNKQKKVNKNTLDYYETKIKILDSEFKKKSKDTHAKDSLFYKFEQKYHNIISEMNKKEIVASHNIDSNYWVKEQEAEGYKYFVANYKYLKNQYGTYLSDTYNSWLYFQDKTEKILEDGQLLIEPDELRKNILELETLINNNPNFIAIEEMKNKIKWLLRLYLIGTDNSPIFDIWDTQKMNNNFKISYEKFLYYNKDSMFYPLIKEFYNKAKEQNFTYNDNFNIWKFEIYEKYID